MISTILWNTSVRLAQADPYFEKSKQLKDVVSTLYPLMPKYEKFFDGKIPGQWFLTFCEILPFLKIFGHKLPKKINKNALKR